MRRLPARLALFACLALLGGCTGEPAADRSPSAAPESGPQAEIQFRAVSSASPGACATAAAAAHPAPTQPATLAGRDEICYQLEPAGLTTRRFARLTVIYDTSAGQNEPCLEVELLDADQAAFETYTAAHVNRQVAVVVDGVVYTAPTIVEPISAGIVQICSKLTQAEADRLRARLGS